MRSCDNLLWRRHAQRLLVERGKLDVVPELVKLVADQSTDAIGLNVGATGTVNANAGTYSAACCTSCTRHPPERSDTQLQCIVTAAH